MNNETEIQKAFRIWATSDQIEHYKAPLIPAHIKDQIAAIMIAAFLGFVAGFYIAVRFFISGR